MAVTCPAGHESTTSDFCDVCGAPIDATTPSAIIPLGGVSTPPARAVAASPPSSLNLPAPASALLTCSNCATVNPADALFCEACGYDFTTGQLPATPPTVAPIPAAEWVAELWIDTEWFEHQDAPGGVATSGAPTVVPLRATVATIGRRSKSRNLSPDLDCSGDGAVSHMHAQLVLDRDRWYVEDLGSTNGTFVGAPGDPLPDTPLPPRQRRELADDERVYIGAWTRIVVRRATDNEKSAPRA
ncbi:MAG: FHA domain-containing protein [Acidimicrobiia bacterium]